MRERERERARARSRSPGRDLAVVDRDLQSTISSPRPRSPVRRSRAVVDRDLATPLIAISRSGSRSRSTTQSREDRDLAVDRDLACASSHRIEIAINGANSRRSRFSRRSRYREEGEIAIAPSTRLTARSSDGFFLRCGLCFSLHLCFPSSFPNTRKCFPENFLKCNQTPWKHFPFPEISISGKYVFSGNRFTPTKHSLSIGGTKKPYYYF